MTDRITSPANPRVTELARLKDRRGRQAQRRFLIEGHRELQRAVEAGVVIEIVAYAPDLAGQSQRIDAAYVEKNIGALAASTDLSRYVL